MAVSVSQGGLSFQATIDLKQFQEQLNRMEAGLKGLSHTAQQSTSAGRSPAWIATDSFEALPAPDREAEATANAANAGQRREVLRKEVLHAAVAVAEGLDAAAELVGYREP